jgi:hypothetical protein
MKGKQALMAAVALCFFAAYNVFSVSAECTDAQLYTEVSTDPATLAYATAYGQPVILGSKGNDQALLDALNLVRQGAPFQIQRTLMPAYEIAALMNPAEFNALTDIKQQQLVSIFAPLQVDVSSQNMRDILFNGPTSIFPNPGATRTALINAVKRQGSRAEVVCGSNRTLGQLSQAIRGTQ